MASSSAYARALRRSLSLSPSPGQPAFLRGLRPQLQPSVAPERHLVRPFSSFSSTSSSLANPFRCSSGFNCTCSQVTCIHFKQIKESRFPSHREYSVFKEFSKQLKGEANSNSEFQQSVKELNEKFGVVKEDLKVRTQKTTEKIYKSVDDVWTEAEATSKKVTANVKEKLSAAKEEVTANMKEKFSAAKEEVKETLGLGKEEPSASSHGSPGATNANNQSTSGATHAEDCKESAQQAETFYDKFKTLLSSTSPKVSLVFQKLKGTKISDFAKRGYDIVKDELSSKQRRKKHIEYTSPSVSSEPRSTRTDIVIVASKKSRIGEKWEALKTKMQGHPAFKHMKNYSEPVVAKGQELAEDMRDRWETSDNPVVHKIQDLNETVFGETAAALSFKEIRRRDPSFSLQDFLAEVQQMIQPVLKAYFKCDVEALKKYCCSEVIERCKGERRAYESQDMFFDNKILHISEVDVRETKMMGSSPIIIVAFQTQQIYCVRDRSGDIKAGGTDTIQTVYYAWAMQQLDPEELGEDAYYPVWRLREMQQLNVQALI